MAELEILQAIEETGEKNRGSIGAVREMGWRKTSYLMSLNISDSGPSA